jgi:hypothetical protein
MMSNKKNIWEIQEKWNGQPNAPQISAKNTFTGGKYSNLISKSKLKSKSNLMKKYEKYEKKIRNLEE